MLRLSVTPVGPENIVVTKCYSEYYNTTLSVVHELYTAQFQCSSPLFPLGNAKLIKFGQITKFFKMQVRVLSDNYFFVFPLVFLRVSTVWNFWTSASSSIRMGK